MAGVSVVLPFLLAEKGIYWAAGLLYPTFSIGFIAGNALSPLVVERSRRHQNAVIATAAATIAALTSCIAVAELRDAFVAPVFLLASLLIGCAMGMANNAYAEIISRMLDRPRRNQLLLNQEAIGAVLTVVATLLILSLVSGRNPVASRIDVLWRRHGGGVRGRDDRRAHGVGCAQTAYAVRRRLPRKHQRGLHAQLVTACSWRPRSSSCRSA